MHLCGIYNHSTTQPTHHNKNDTRDNENERKPNQPSQTKLTPTLTYPHTLTRSAHPHPQAEKLDEMLRAKGGQIDKVVNLTIADDLLLKRITGRYGMRVAWIYRCGVHTSIRCIRGMHGFIPSVGRTCIQSTDPPLV